MGTWSEHIEKKNAWRPLADCIAKFAHSAWKTAIMTWRAVNVSSWGCSSVVERPLRMRNVPGSNPGTSSNSFLIFFFSLCSQLGLYVLRLLSGPAGECHVIWKYHMDKKLNSVRWIGILPASSNVGPYFFFTFSPQGFIVSIELTY